MANSIVQTIRDAEVDARSLSEFISKDAYFTVTRRLAPTIHTLDYYLLVLNKVKDKGDLADIAISDTLDKLERLEPTVIQRVEDAINNTAIEGGVLADTFVTVTSNAVGSVARTQRDKNNDVLNIRDFILPSETTIDNAFYRAQEALKNTGGTIEFTKDDYLVSGNLLVNYDNIFLSGNWSRLIRDNNTQAGFMVQFATTNDTFGGGGEKFILVGVRDPASGNGGWAMGSNPHYANDWNVRDIVCTDWGQYGFAIYNGNDWYFDNIRVLNHGHITTAISSCMAFNIFPRGYSSGGVGGNIYAEIADDSKANSASVKLQTHDNATLYNIVGKGGTESGFVIDSVGGTISNIKALPGEGTNANRTGFAIGNYNPAHEFRHTFILDGVFCDDVGFKYSILIGALLESDTVPKLKGCTLRNIRATDFVILNRTAWQDCTFENIKCSATFKLAHNSNSVIEPTVEIINNTYTNIEAKSTLSISSSNSRFSNLVSNIGTVIFYGDNNNADLILAKDAVGNGTQIVGSNNYVLGVNVNAPNGRLLWIKSGNDNIVQGITKNSDSGGVLDQGENNIVDLKLITKPTEPPRSSGPTNSRPADPPIGFAYFDTILGKPVFFKSEGVWVDSAGVVM